MHVDATAFMKVKTMQTLKLICILVILFVGCSQALASGYIEKLRMTGYSENEINDIL